MSVEHEMNIKGHPNIYTGNSARDLKVYICEPSSGINEHTGLCLLIAGYGASSQSKVYRKMRSTFADKHNLVTIQCDYFGQAFMTSELHLKLSPDRASLENVLTKEELLNVYDGGVFHQDKLLELSSEHDVTFNCETSLDESPDNFNDMGIMQSLDNLTALTFAIGWVSKQHPAINTRKIIAYGHSHGAYLAYLCNAFAPKLLSLIIDNSAWLLPNYLMTKRTVIAQVNRFLFNTTVNYLMETLTYDFDLLCLPILYQTFRNECRIASFQGSSDNLVLPDQKRAFCNTVERCSYIEIGESQVDGRIFHSTDHGLDADFLNLFHFVIDNYDFGESNDRIELPTVNIETKQSQYRIAYTDGVPLLQMEIRK